MSDTIEAVAAVAEPAKPEKEPVLLNLQQAKMHKARLERKQCYVKNESAAPECRWRGITAGPAADIKNAQRWSVSDAISYHSPVVSYPNIKLQLVDQELAEELLKKKCSIAAVLTIPVVELLKLAPTNPQARAHVLAQTGKMPPDDADTYEKVEQWVEENCGDIRPVSPDVAANPNAFEIQVSYSRQTHGMCEYTLTKSGSQARRVSRETIDRIMADNPNHSYAYVASLLSDNIRQNIRRDPPGMNGDGYNYDNHENQSEDPIEVSVRGGIGNLNNKVADYIRATRPPEEQRRRGV